jgi:ketosteroid isomerase-like protein
MVEKDLLQRAADEADIRNVIARLAHLADDGDLNEYVLLFTDDGTWERPGEKIRGRQDLLAGARQRRESGIQGPGTNTHHVNTTLWVQLDGADEASAQSYYLMVGDTDTAAPAIRSIGRYLDTFRRTAEGWKLASRKIVPG